MYIKPKACYKRLFAFCVVFSMFLMVLSMSVHAETPLIEQIDPQYTIKYVSVAEYDFVTDSEITYQMSYREYEILNDDFEYKLNEEESVVSPQTVFPDDEYQWEQVPTSMYSTYPYKAICALYAGFRATAFIVGTRIAMTCAHCVYDADEATWDTEAYILPHAPGNCSSNYIVTNGTRVLKAIIPTAYKTNPTASNDWAILIVEDDVGTSNGVLALDCSTPTVGTEVCIIGYPQYGVNNVLRYMHESPGEITLVNTNYIRYNCDTYDGNSGSPVIRQSTVNGEIRYNVVAVHAGGNATYNSAHRIDQFLVNAVRELDAEYD